MSRLTIPIDRIVVPERLRVDYGDIEDLARSIQSYGLIQPIVLTDENVLIAGGRRLSAHKALGKTTIDVCYRSTLSEDERVILELEENVRRKDFDWRERVRSIRNIHLIKKRLNAIDGNTWGFRETGELLGYAHSQVAYALEAAALLDANDPQVVQCANLSEFLRLMVFRRETEANKVLASRGLRQSAEGNGKPIVGTIAQQLLAMPAPIPAATPVVAGDAPRKYEARISQWLYNGRWEDYLTDENKSDPAGNWISYIITDPPYAIDVDVMEQNAPMSNLDTVREEHDAEANVKMLEAFIPTAYHHMKESGSWLVMWCDPDKWNWLKDLCEKAGFRVTQWPLVWIKTHACVNTNAMKNFTKTCEFALVAAKGNASLVAPQPVGHYACSNDETRRLLGHPFAKPLDLWKWVYKAIVPPGRAVFDPFMGRGSSTLAAIDLGLTPYGCEVSPTHYAYLYNNVRERYIKQLGKDSVVFT